MIRNYTTIALLVTSAFCFVGSTDTRQPRLSANDVIGCAPGNNENVYAGTDGKFFKILPGWGNYHYAITTANDSAQLYFNQGLTMYYSYHAREAIASFKEAARFDSTSAMIYWGQALAMGPTYNYGHLYKFNKNLPAVVTSMNRYAATASPKEKDLITAMNKRYIITDTSDAHRHTLNIHYAEALKPLVEKYPDDIDVKALYVDAVMLIHPWDFWNNDGTPKAWTNEIVRYCRDILSKQPHHAAGLHYYIHTTEASRNPEVALFCADSLKKLFPGIAHMVHMSSHEYERIGYYALGVDANEKADRSMALYDSLVKGLYPAVHVAHYYSVDAYCALSGAMRQAMAKALAIRPLVSPTHVNTYAQYQYMFPEFAMVRLGKWQDILEDTVALHPDWTYAAVLCDFAKGMAHAKTGNIPAAEKYLVQLRAGLHDSVLKIKFTPYQSSPYECAIIAENILNASILFAQKNYPAAIISCRKAIAAEEKLLYTEPRIWMLPARQYLGALYMHLGKPADAEKVYREDLAWNPGNGWSLLGLYQSLVAQNKLTEAAMYKQQYENSFSHAEEIPAASAY